MKNIRNMSRIIYSLIYLFIAIFFLYGLMLTDSAKETASMLMGLEKQGYVLLFVWGYFCIFLILFKMRKILINSRKRDFLFFLIILASCPRIFVMCKNHYIPNNDFKLYYDVGVHLIEGDKAFVNEFVARYGATYGGLAVFMGIIAKLFSVKLIGFQIANIAITSFICVFIYLITENYNRKAAIIASILFAIYPENIISTQITTNHHGAVLFTLISIFCLIKAEKRYRNIYATCVISGVALAISDFIHPSIIIPIVAIMCWGVLGCSNGRREVRGSRYIRLRKCFLTILVCEIIITISLNMLRKDGIIANNTDISQGIPIGKIAVGLNYETRGRWSEEDSKSGGNLKKQIKERIFDTSVTDILSLMRDKIDIVWFEKGSYFSWYWSEWYQILVNKKSESEGTLNENLIKELEIFSVYTSYQLFDWFFLKIIYIFAILGLVIIALKKKQNAGVELVAWILLGWILIHLLIEVQERYRYLGMPYIFIFSAIGMYEIYRRLMFMIRFKKRTQCANETIRLKT